MRRVVGTWFAAVEQELERRLEGVLDLRPVEPELEAGRHVGDNRRHDEARDDQVIVQVADATDPVAGQSDLLLRFAHRRLPRSGVAGLDPPAREADLARVIRELRRALREQHREPIRPVDQRNQHRGTRPGLRQVLAQLLHAAVGLREPGDQRGIGAAAAGLACAAAARCASRRLRSAGARRCACSVTRAALAHAAARERRGIEELRQLLLGRDRSSRPRLRGSVGPRHRPSWRSRRPSRSRSRD